MANDSSFVLKSKQRVIYNMCPHILFTQVGYMSTRKDMTYSLMKKVRCVFRLYSHKRVVIYFCRLNILLLLLLLSSSSSLLLLLAFIIILLLLSLLLVLMFFYYLYLKEISNCIFFLYFVLETIPNCGLAYFFNNNSPKNICRMT